MRVTRLKVTALVCLMGCGSTINARAQAQRMPPACSERTLASVRQLPKLDYSCPEGLAGYDEKILRLPQRLAAIRGVVTMLAGLTNANWWQATVAELNACGVHEARGALTDEETERWKSGDYHFELLGKGNMRIALIDDPCYQTGFSGSNAFLLYRKGGRVFVSQLLDGYYSRVDNSVGIDFAKLNGQQIIEVSTANSMPPSLVYYYFGIDPKTNKASPKNIFRVGNKLTNQIYSAMLMSEPKDLGLPANAAELRVIEKERLRRGFSAYEENDPRGTIDVDGRKLRRIIYRWNGRFYVGR